MKPVLCLKDIKNKSNDGNYFDIPWRRVSFQPEHAEQEFMTGRSILWMMPALALLALGGCRRGAGDSRETPVPRVAVTPIDTWDLVPTVHVSGVMAPSEQIDVHPRSAGVVASVGVDIGDYVRKGEKIATMSAPEGGGEGERILAPFDGVVTRRYLVAGSLVAEGLSSTSPIVNIAQDTVLRASFSVPESALQGLGPGAPLAIEIPELGRRIDAKVSRISGLINPLTRTMPVEADVPNGDRKILPGSYAQASVSLPASRQVLALPAYAIKYESTPVVFVVNEESKVEKKRVRVGANTGDKVEIIGGLKAGELVVIGNTSELVPGMKVIPEVREFGWTDSPEQTSNDGQSPALSH